MESEGSRMANLWSDEQKEYAEVFDYSKITEKSGVITDYWTNNLLDLILRKDNLNNAYKQVKRNKGKGGIDGMQVDELLPFLKENQEKLIQGIREGKYKPNPVRRVEIPKETRGEFSILRKLKLEHRQAIKLANSRCGYWRMAGMLGTVITNKIIAKLRYTSLLDHYLIVGEN